MSSLSDYTRANGFLIGEPGNGQAHSVMFEIDQDAYLRYQHRPILAEQESPALPTRLPRLLPSQTQPMIDGLIRVPKTSAATEILNAFGTQANQHHLLIGPQKQTDAVIIPPDATEAVVVNIDQGIINVYNGQKEKKYVGSIGVKHKENIESFVIIPWTTEWVYFTLGTISIQYIVRK